MNLYNLYLVKTGNCTFLRLFSKKINEQIFAKYSSVTSPTSRHRSLPGAPDHILTPEYISKHFLKNVPGYCVQHYGHTCTEAEGYGNVMQGMLMRKEMKTSGITLALYKICITSTIVIS